jgi:hypothetical protein
MSSSYLKPLELLNFSAVVCRDSCSTPKGGVLGLFQKKPAVVTEVASRPGFGNVIIEAF